MARESEGISAGAGERGTWIVVLLSAVWIRWAVGLAGWSGKGISPMYGDLEAQRHWMELTLHVPVHKWYEYDLQYWGLDYPPLTAYVSLVCGWIGSRIPGLSQCFAFVTSRGAENRSLVTYLRATVLFFDALVYIPAVLFFLSRRLHGRGRRTRSIAAMTILLQPSLVLIDHGHFQYNSVMLGFCVGAFSLLYSSLPNPDLPFFSAPVASASDPSTETALAQQTEWQTRTRNLSRRVSYDYVLAAFFFTLALCFKQMALYFAPAVFAIMLGRCAGLARVGFERGLICFTGIGAVTLITTLVLFSPWLYSPSALFQVIHRIFPLARGIFEDKVSNVWCFLSVLPLPQRYKLRNLFEVSSLAKVSLIATLLAILAPCAHLYVAASQTVTIEMFLNEGKGAKAAREKLARQRGEGSVMGRSAGGRSAGRSERRDRTRSILSVPGAPARSEAGASEGGVAPSISGAMSNTGSLFGSSKLTTVGDQEVASNTPSPAASVLPYALLNTSLAFFLLGFQTHEKSILLPLVPLSLLITVKGDEWGGGGGKTDFEWAMLGNNVAVFSMWPLLQRDGLTLQYLVLNFLWNWSAGYNPFLALQSRRKSLVGWTSAMAHAAILALHLVEVLLPALAPGLAAHVYDRYPDIHPVLNVLLCTPLFGLIWVWAVARQVEVGVGCGIDPTAFLRRSSKKRATSHMATNRRQELAKQE
ncbi:ALG6, ALG8 glycosyltransferase [Ceraceosorus guamensis]|uniref:Alpha-1,3-glucosyltransferase n=1 Tax=Ceraceosorus guamensis TaxID=1522189 RepID=A0A316W2F0_9BASI|nr:ALG6, ALG8 glycosyltransferase [Ceraceosorus guamensis]PWN43940.1 ALG6, ALG8 glycosyltransferase [Ceraceosorus guamensis]